MQCYDTCNLRNDAHIFKPRKRGHIAGKGRQHLAQAKAEAKAYRRELHEVLGVLKTDPRMAELLSQVGSQSKMGSVSRTRGGSVEGGSIEGWSGGGRSGEDGSGKNGDDDEGQ
ncbi:hypothetical protein Tco_1119179 [Tanacetum coccineum]